MGFNSRRSGCSPWLRVFLVASGAVMLAGFATCAAAYGQDDTRTAGADRTQASKGQIVIGDEAIDPIQPIKPDFVITVVVSGESEPSGSYKVDSVGKVSIRYAGIMTPVSVKNMTPAQAQDAIASFLKTYIKNPVVSVTITDIPRASVFIGGAVRVNGKAYINSDTTLLDVITRAEYTEAADLSQVKIIRRDQPDAIYVDFEKFIHSRRGEKVDEGLNPPLKDKDRIWIPSRSAPGATGTISIFGEVTRPTAGVPLRSTAPMTVREVVNLAGGPTLTADRHRVSVRRFGMDKPLVVDLDKAEQGDLANNIELRADDTVYVERLDENAYINVNGGFVRPGKLIYDKRTTLTQAIAEAGGPAPYAKTKKGYVQRHPDSDPKHTRIIPFNFNDILAAKSQDIELQAGDAIYIEPGGPPRSSMGPLEWLGALTSTSYLFNSISGRRLD